MELDTGILIAWVLFGSIGLGALTVGKKLASIKIMLVGLTMLVYPCFTIQNPYIVWLTGALLTALLFIFWEY